MTTFSELYPKLLVSAESGVESSETAKWLAGGVHSIGKKIVEEAAEVWMAAEHESNERLAEEISQLLYHLQVMMIAKQLTLSDVEKFL